MKYLFIIALVIIVFFICAFTLRPKLKSQISLESLYALTFIDISGQKRQMEEFRGKNILIVNVASECGFTYQYKDLQNLYINYKDDLVVIGFPCNQFGKQEPGSDSEIQSFCEAKYDISFLLATKVNVKGVDQHPIYEWLTSKELNGYSNSSVKWNFQKYFINREGHLVDYFYSVTNPRSKKIISLIK